MKIAFTGTHCTGKTTLLNEIKVVYNKDGSFGYVPEVARKIIDKGYPLNADANTDSYIHYINEQLKSEQKINNYELFVSDRTLLDPLAYALINKELPRPYIRNYFIEMIENVWLLEKERYDLYIYFPIEFPLNFDNVRSSDEDYRRDVDKMIYSLLTKYNVKYVTIRGAVEKRLETFLNLIKKAE